MAPPGQASYQAGGQEAPCLRAASHTAVAWRASCGLFLASSSALNLPSFLTLLLISMTVLSLF